MFRILLTLGAVFASTLQQTQAADKWWKGGAGTANNSTADWYPTDAVTTLGIMATTDKAIFSVGSPATAFTISGTPTATGGLTVEDGTVTIGSTWGAFGTAPLRVNSGATLVISVSTSISTTAGSVLTLAGGRMRNSNTATTGSFIDIDTTITLSGGGIISGTGGAAAQTVIQPTTIISGTGPLTKDGNAIVAVAAVCTYSGATIVNDGTLRCRTTPNVFPIATDLTVTSPGVFSLNGIAQRVGSLTGNGSVTLGNATLTIGGSTSPAAFSGAITSTTGGDVTKTGTGTLTLSGPNAFNGTLTLTTGTITVNSGGALCDPVCDVVVNGGILNLNNTAQGIKNLTGTGGTINLGTGHTLTSGAIASGTYSGTIAGAGGFTKTDSFNQTFSGPNSYDGVTAITGIGTITVLSATGLGSTVGKTTVASGAGVNFNGGASLTVNEPFDIAGVGNGVATGGAINVGTANTAITFGGTVTLTANASGGVSSAALASGIFSGSPAFTGSGFTLTLNGSSGTGTKSITGAITLGSGGLTKLQSGTWNLSGVNTYTGPTTITTGRLNVNSPGSLHAGSTVTVAVGATLGGTGTIGGPTTVSGTVAPGTSIGTLTFTVAPTLSGTTAMEINKAAGPVLTSDKLVVSTGGGTLAYAGTLALTASGLAITNTDTFDLFDADTFSGSFSSITPATPGAGLVWDISQLAVNGTISVACDGTLPAGGADAFSTPTNTAVSISSAKLKANDTGSGLSITGVNSPSTQGGTVTLSGTDGLMTYTPPSSTFGGSDTFTYVLINDQGCTKNVTVTATVGNGTAQGANAVYTATEGSEFVARFAGIPGETYTVEHAASATGPWSKLGANKTAPTDNSLGYGIGVFVVREATSGTEAGFYRTVYPAY